MNIVFSSSKLKKKKEINKDREKINIWLLEKKVQNIFSFPNSVMNILFHAASENMQCYLNFVLCNLFSGSDCACVQTTQAPTTTVFVPHPWHVTRYQFVFVHVFIYLWRHSLFLIFIKFMAVIIHVHVYRYLIKHRTKINRLEFFFKTLLIVHWLKFFSLPNFRNRMWYFDKLF